MTRGGVGGSGGGGGGGDVISILPTMGGNTKLVRLGAAAAASWLIKITIKKRK
jgi:hypothetical protein